MRHITTSHAFAEDESFIFSLRRISNVLINLITSDINWQNKSQFADNKPNRQRPTSSFSLSIFHAPVATFMWIDISPRGPWRNVTAWLTIHFRINHLECQTHTIPLSNFIFINDFFTTVNGMETSQFESMEWLINFWPSCVVECC